MTNQSKIRMRLNSVSKPSILIQSKANWPGSTKRGRMEIFAGILLFCDRRRSKTNIMYKTNMNYSQLQSNLIFLSLRGLLDCEMDKYVTAEKGYRFLELFTEMQSILNDEVV